MKERITVLLTAVMIAVFSIAGPALAQSAAHTGVRYRGKVVAAPGGSGAPLGVETSTKKISGTAGNYVRFPAKITNTSLRQAGQGRCNLPEPRRCHQGPAGAGRPRGLERASRDHHILLGTGAVQRR
jgi:hypothetical protein